MNSPLATAVLDQVLTTTASLPVPEALIVESLAYSTLLAGPEFAAWLATRERRLEVPPSTDPVLVRRDATELRITLNRPERRNALGSAVRAALVDALAVAEADPDIRRVVLDGAGPAFCAGGDLDEFGTAEDPVHAHLLRVAQSPGAALHRLADRVHPVLHGACVGAGVELPAFAEHVVARPDATFRLPELAMGLIPGAGGTVSISRRIGVSRMRDWARSGEPFDATTALAWGLVDEIVP